MLHCFIGIGKIMVILAEAVVALADHSHAFWIGASDVAPAIPRIAKDFGLVAAKWAGLEGAH